MKGTEKQINWAKQIIADRKVMANELVSKSAYWNGYRTEYPAFDFSAVIEMLDSLDDAAEIISNRDKGLIDLYIAHIGWKAPEKQINASDDPFAL